MSEMPLSARVKLVIVTGMSGAGRTTTIRCLEDLGYETIDNLPISLVSRVVAPGMLGAKIAIGLDTRTRDFTTKAVLDMLAELSAHSWLSLEVVLSRHPTRFWCDGFPKRDAAIHWPLLKRHMTELTGNAIC